MLPEELSPKDVEKVKRIYDHYDHNKGGMPVGEMGNALRELFLVPSEAEVAQAMQDADTKQNGRIKFPDFLNMAARHWFANPGDRDTKLWVAFLAFDTFDRGKLDSQSMRHILCELGEPIPEKEAEKMIKANIDKKTDLVDYTMLVRLWLKH